MTSAAVRINVRDMADATFDHTPEALHARIVQRMNELGLSANAASLKAGLSRDFVRNTLRRPGQVPHVDNLTKLAAGLETSFEWLRWGEKGKPGPGEVANRPRPDVDPVAAVNLEQLRAAMPLNMPVYGTVAASLAVRHEGAFEMENRVIEFVRRPPALFAVPDAYAFYVAGNSMVPAHMPGEVRFVHPYRPARQGDTVVIQAQYADHAGIEAFLGLYERRTAETVYIRKLNPASTVEFASRYVRAIHRVLTMNELFGI